MNDDINEENKSTNLNNDNELTIKSKIKYGVFFLIYFTISTIMACRDNVLELSNYLYFLILLFLYSILGTLTIYLFLRFKSFHKRANIYIAIALISTLLIMISFIFINATTIYSCFSQPFLKINTDLCPHSKYQLIFYTACLFHYFYISIASISITSFFLLFIKEH